MRIQWVMKAIAAVLACAITVTGVAQQTASISKQAERVKRSAESLAAGAPISVVRVHRAEEYGTLISCDEEGFTFHDVDSKVDVALKYGEVKKIKNGYGGYNTARGRHTDRTRATIVVLVVAGLLGGLIAAAASSKN